MNRSAYHLRGEGYRKEDGKHASERCPEHIIPWAVLLPPLSDAAPAFQKASIYLHGVSSGATGQRLRFHCVIYRRNSAVLMTNVADMNCRL